MYKTIYLIRDVRFEHIRKIPLSMRLTIVILLIPLFQLSAKGTFGQKVSFRKNNTTLEEVFRVIKIQTGYNVVWSNRRLDGAEPVDVNFRKATVDKVMDEVLKGRAVAYEIIDNAIVIRSAESPYATMFQKVISVFTAIDVKGRVLDENGLPLIGAVVKVKGGDRSASTSTNVKGEFLLKGVDDKALIMITFLGYGTQIIKASNDMGDIKLLAVTDNLDGVEINAGYYTVKERERTGSIARVDAKTIAQQPINNPLEALVGRMAGVNIEQQTGVPGGGFKVEIRGVNSLRPEGREPLYLINGVPFPSTKLTNNNLGVGSLSIGNGASPLNYINAGDIESVEVLKDADATAIYGSRGANGVILIKTKSAKAGKTQFDINLSTGISKVQKKINLLNTDQYIMMRKEAFFINDKLTESSPSYAIQYDINGTWDQNKYTDWQDTFIGGKARTTMLTANLSGGNENTQFSFRSNYLTQGTVFPGDFVNRKGSGTLSVYNLSPNKKLKSSFNATYGLDNNTQPRTDFTSNITLPPNAPDLFNANGELNWALNNNGSPTWKNPIAEIFNVYNSTANSIITSSTIDYEVLPGLSLRSSMGYTNVRLREDLKLPVKAQDPSQPPSGTHQISNNTISTWILEPQINYQSKIGNGHFDILLGSTFQKNVQKLESLSGLNYTSDLLLENITAAPTKGGSSSETEYKYNAVFGRINYNYASKYIVNLTARRDGSSKFGPEKQFANFGAIGAAWCFTNESNFKSLIPIISYGKLRASYGITGNDQIPDYEYLSTYSATRVYNGGTGLAPTRLANPDYSWETSKKLEFAIDLGFINDRIIISTSYYRNRSSNQLVGYPLSDVTGFSSIQFNLPATVQNTGWEFELNSNNIKTNYFSWNTSVNLSIPKNKLLSYPNIEGSSYANTYTVGQSMFTPNVYHFIKVDPQLGLYSYADLNGNGKEDQPDKDPASRSLTNHWFGGLNNSLSFKNFQLDIFLQFVNKTVLDPLSQFTSPGTMNNQPLIILNRWQKPGDITDIQKFSQVSGTGSALQKHSFLFTSDRFSNASYLRLKNISLTWSLPTNWIKSAKLNNIKLLIQGQNLLTFSNYIGNPDIVGFQNLPPLTTLIAGIQLGI
jgi:TonB-linked SusC/RagA family outer membrane protein